MSVPFRTLATGSKGSIGDVYHQGPTWFIVSNPADLDRLIFPIKWCVTKAETSPPNCADDGGRSPGIGLQGQISNHRVLLRSKDAVVSDAGKVVR